MPDEQLVPWFWVCRFKAKGERYRSPFEAKTYVEARAIAPSLLGKGATLDNTEVRALFEYEMAEMRARKAAAA